MKSRSDTQFRDGGMSQMLGGRPGSVKRPRGAYNNAIEYSQLTGAEFRVQAAKVTMTASLLTKALEFNDQAHILPYR